MRLPQCRQQLYGASQGRDRLLPPPLPFQRGAEIVVRDGKPRIEADRVLKAIQRRVSPVRQQAYRSDIAIKDGIVGAEPQGFPQRRDRLVEPAGFPQAAGSLHPGIIRFRFDGIGRILCLQQRREFAEPRLISAPAFGRAAIDRLARLPHAGSFDLASVIFRPQAGFVPVEAQEVDHAPGNSFAVADQLLVIHFQQRIGRQHVAPMGGKAFVGPEVERKVPLVVGERHGRGEVGEVVGQAGIHRVAPAVEDPPAREQDVEQADPEEVPRHFVGNPARIRRYPAQCRLIGADDTFRMWLGQPGRTEPRQFRGRLGPEGQFVGAGDFRVAGDDLLHQRRAGARHAEDQHRQFGRRAKVAMRREERLRMGCDQALHAGAELRPVERLPARGDPIRRVEVPHRRRIVAEIVGRLAKAVMHPHARQRLQRPIGQQRLHLIQHRPVLLGDALRHREVVIG